MHMRLTQIFAGIIGGMIFASCASQQASTSILYSNYYDKKKDQSAIIMFPYGSVMLPGKWTDTHYNSVSGQQFLQNADSVEFAVALTPWNRYEFYRQGMTEAEFVKAFYEWDSAYLQQQTGCQVRIVKDAGDRNIIIWNIRRDPTYNTYYLFGLRNQIVYNLSIKTQTWDEETIAAFLEKAYSN